MDGGLADNIGARAVLDAYDRGFIRTRINQGAIDQLVVIVVNARTKSEDTLSIREKAARGHDRGGQDGHRGHGQLQL
ncbi:MAG: hypothetical protein KGY41_05240 [Desulfovermiculus sp.]|nr:hypothetical protein [Desulfovermiculus sp.]